MRDGQSAQITCVLRQKASRTSVHRAAQKAEFAVVAKSATFVNTKQVGL